MQAPPVADATHSGADVFAQLALELHDAHNLDDGGKGRPAPAGCSPTPPQPKTASPSYLASTTTHPPADPTNGQLGNTTSHPKTPPTSTKHRSPTSYPGNSR